MKKISPSVFLLVLAKLTHFIRGEFYILSGPPEYSRAHLLYTYHHVKDMYCITDELDSALTWNSNLEWIDPKFVDLNAVGNPIVLKSNNVIYPMNSNFTCSMSSKFSCSHQWTRLGNWNFVTSLAKPISPVSDSRWEDFKEEKMSDQFKAITMVPSIGSFAVSIRGATDAHFALCNEDNTSSFCFYIILGGWKNTKSVIRMCKNGIPEPATKIPSGDCRQAIVFSNGTVLSSTEWKTFVIKWDFEKQISLTVLDSNKNLLNYSIPREENYFPGHRRTPTENPEYFLFVRSQVPLLMKFHFYDYLFTTTTQSKLISPEIMSINKNMCIEMSISLCKKCFVTIDFVDRNGKRKAVETVQNRIKGNLYNLPAWQKVKINTTLTQGMQQPIKLEINTLLGNTTNKNNSYWAVSNIRRCYDGALKVVKINAYQDYNVSSYFWPVVTCQKISTTGVSTVIDSTDQRVSSLSAATRPLCIEGYIGSSCTVDCSKLFPNTKYCNKLLACDEQGCFCGQGFSMSSLCSEGCSASKYGFECTQTCGNCANEVCNFITGECKSGCYSNENKLYIAPYCKIGVGSPVAPGVDLINSTCVRLYLDVEKEYKIIPTSVHFEIWTNQTQFPFQISFTSERINVQKSTVSIQTHVDSLSPGTRYKCLALLHAENRIFRGEWTNFTTPCTESVTLNFIISSNETSITLNNLVDVNVNDSCPYTWYRVQLLSEVSRIFDGPTAFPKTFTQLEPFTHYKVVVASERATIMSKITTTLEGVPTAVNDLSTLSSSIDYITIAWKPPDKPRGKLVNYTAEIQLVESRGCSDLDKPSYNSSSSDLCKRCHMKTVITNTSQNNYNQVFYGLKPYARYLFTVYASTSRHQGEKTELLHETASIDTPTEVFIDLRLTNESSSTIAAYLRWNAPEDCSTITGPILASKLFFKKSGFNYTEVKTNNYYYPLEKSSFAGAETYEVYLYPLRYFDQQENKTTYTSLEFTLPPRAPPPVRNAEIIEVDIINRTITLKWTEPVAPIHGQLDHYSIIFCKINSRHCNRTEYIMNLNEFCRFDDIKYAICKTIPLPSSIDYDLIQIKSHNVNVTEASEPISLPVRRIEFAPSAPLDLILNVVSEKNSTINISWSHPLESGGRLEKFKIKARAALSTLKAPLWNEKSIFLKIDTANYQARYAANLELFPSSIFAIEVRAVTVGGLIGDPLEGEISLFNSIGFSTEDLQPRINDDLTVSIKVPEVVHDVIGSSMVLIVEGPKYCDDGSSNNEDVKLFLDSQSSSYYKIAWKVAVLTHPESYANAELKIGDGTVTGDLKNYALCSKESYILHLILFEDFMSLDDKKSVVLRKSILKAIKTNAIHLGELPKNYAVWLTPLFFVILISMLLIIVLFRKRLASRLARNKTKVCLQENMPLTNEISTNITNNLVDKSEKGMIGKDIKDLPNNNILTIDNKQEFVMPVKVGDFEKYFESAYKSGALVKEYSSIKSGPINPCIYGSQLEVKPKNRYANLFPYDETRVVLEKLPDDPYSDYINASFITGYGGRKKAYIATQGPKPNTVIDFWRMICQERVRIICMMANTIENGKVKCEQYWPSTVGKKMLYGKISVQYWSEEVHSDYTYRIFRISCENQEPRTIEHLHYTAWPDHGVPSTPRSIVTFLKEIQKHSPAPREHSEPPIVIHCSAGVGRTGTLIVLDMSVCRAFSENVIDVHANVLSTRKERLNMVDNTEQYLLVHLILVEYLNTQNTCFPCDNFLPKKIAEAKKDSSYQYKRISDTNWWNEILGSPPVPEKSLSNKNRAKHRFPELAGGSNRLYLKRSIITDEDSDYIAATSVKGIFKNCQYITTQLPMPSTFGDFWRMLSEQNVELVIVLQLPNLQDSSYCELVPENQGFGNTKYIKVIRQENSTIDTQYYYKEEVQIIDSSEVNKAIDEPPSKQQFVKIISYKNWPESSLPPPIELVNLWKVLEEFPKISKYPIVIVCRNGVTASGIWLALSFLLKRMLVDKECDVTQVVRAIKKYRKDFLHQPEHLGYLYDVALAWPTKK